jgi:hypothetical protein
VVDASAKTIHADMKLAQKRNPAAECLRIADDTTNPQNKILLIAMAQAWLRLAQQAEKNLTTDLVGTPPRREALSRPVMQQQQQIQPEREE